MGQVQVVEKEFQSCKFLYEFSKKSLEDKSLNFKSLFEELVFQLDSCCERIKVLLEVKMNELVCISCDKVDVIFVRLF